jgi:hypothetical protein
VDYLNLFATLVYADQCGSAKLCFALVHPLANHERLSRARNHEMLRIDHLNDKTVCASQLELRLSWRRYGLRQEETVFISMELLHGKTLAAHLQQHGSMTCDQALRSFESMFNCAAPHYGLRSAKTFVLAEDLLARLKAWKQTSQFSAAEDWVFASPFKLGRLPYSYTGTRMELVRASEAAKIGSISTVAAIKTRATALQHIEVLGANVKREIIETGSPTITTFKSLIEHCRDKEMRMENHDKKAYSTKNRNESYLRKWIVPRWGEYRPSDIKSVAVEEWLDSLVRDTGNKKGKPLAGGTLQEADDL